MHLAILMTNTDESAFAQIHPKDGEKFTDLIHLVRPEWTTVVFPVKDNVFPDDLSAFDGAMITGSPASVRDNADWTRHLFDLIRALHRQKTPIFGACFGHQAIAMALGGTMDDNLGGWVHGLIANEITARESWMAPLAECIHLYASHKEQVTEPPKEARVLVTSERCPVAGFAIGNHIYTTQHHPEMAHDFIAALTTEMAPLLGPENTALAQSSLVGAADQKAYAESIARFFEQACTG